MITITIRTDNAAFEDGAKWGEVQRILTEVSRRFSGLPPFDKRILDANGNTVGEVKLTGRDR